MNPKTELIPFDFNGAPIRAISDDLGNPWLVAKDVCDALNLSWSGATLKSIKPEWCSMLNLNTEVGDRKVTIISETAAYKLAFRSRTDKAEQFTDWLATEVLPSIRKTGKYELPQIEPPTELEMLLSVVQNAVNAQREIRQLQADNTERKAEIRQIVARLDTQRVDAAQKRILWKAIQRLGDRYKASGRPKPYVAANRAFTGRFRLGGYDELLMSGFDEAMDWLRAEHDRHRPLPMRLAPAGRVAR